MVDTLGDILAVLVLAANIGDRDGAEWLLRLYRHRYPELRKLWVDGGYAGDFVARMREAYAIELEVVSKLAGQDGFVPLPRRWVVERTLAWLSRCRRLARDYERDPAHSESWVYVAEIHRLLKRLKPDPSVPKPYTRRKAG